MAVEILYNSVHINDSTHLDRDDAMEAGYSAER
jgi:hypothetical protein